MPKAKKVESKESSKKIRPALTTNAQENQMISLAMDLALQRLQNGTASSQEIVHFLKLGSEKSRLEQTKLESENELLKAKTESLKSEKRVEELYEEALNAMRTYSGQRQ